MHDTEQLNDRFVEAARYALMRRLAPVIRHNIAGALQPISMIAVMLERRLQAATPDFSALGKNAGSMTVLAREASSTCMNLMSWIAPRENAPVAVSAGVAESAGLLATELSFKGFNLVNETGAVQAEVPCNVFRSVFMASLIALTDATSSRANIVFTSQMRNDEIKLLLTLQVTGGEVPSSPAPTYRKLDWDDVQVLADAEHVGLQYSADRVELSYRLSADAAAVAGGG